MRIITDGRGHVIGVHTWTDGFKPIVCPARRLSEQEAEAHASWLELHVSSEAALGFIDAWASGAVSVLH